MQQFFSLLSRRLFTAQHVSGVFSPLNMFRAFSRRSTRPRTQHNYHNDTKVKLEAATAVIELLMMGEKTPKTCWAANKRQDNKLENCCIWLVIYLKSMLMFSLKLRARLSNYLFSWCLIGRILCGFLAYQYPTSKITDTNDTYGKPIALIRHGVWPL